MLMGMNLIMWCYRWMEMRNVFVKRKVSEIENGGLVCNSVNVIYILYLYCCSFKLVGES